MSATNKNSREVPNKSSPPVKGEYPEGGRGCLPRLRFPEFRDAGDWKEKQLGDILSVGNGRDHKHLADGNIPVYGSGGYMRSVNEYLYDGESVCIGRKGIIDNPIFLSGKFWTVDTLFYTHSYMDCLPFFAYAIFQNINWLDHNQAGGIPSLSKANIEKIDVAVSTLPEQQKIAACLTSIDNLITAEAQKLDLLKTHKKGLMQKLFPADGEIMPKLRFPGFKGAWEVKRLDDQGDFLPSLQGKRGKDFGVGNALFIPYLNVFRNTFINEEVLGSVNVADKEKQNYVKKGDVFFTISSETPEEVGMSSVLLQNIKNCYLNSFCAMFRFSLGKAPNLAFLGYLLRHFSTRLYFSKHAQGVTRFNLSKDVFKNLPLYIPTLPEQQKIADCLTSIDDLITAEAQKLNALKTHKKGLMQQLFPTSDEVKV